MQSSPKIYHSTSCPFCVPVVTLALATKIPFEESLIDLAKEEHKTPEYAKINPFQKVPAIIESDGYILVESSAILRYLAKAYNLSDNWYPKDPKKSGQVDSSLDWQKSITSTLFEFFGAATTRDFRVTLEDAKNNVGNLLKQIESLYLGDNQYLTGNEISIADLAIITHLLRIKTAGFDFKEYPKVDAYIKRVESDPALKENLDKWVNTISEQMKKKKEQYLKEDAERKKRD